MTIESFMHVQASGRGVVSRRSFLRSVAAGAAGLGVVGWHDAVRLQAAELRKRGMSCILLYLAGGPSQLESFDPKPDAPSEIRGDIKPIATSVPGLQMAEWWPHTAKMMKEIAVMRSVQGVEGDHPGAAFHLHTGYRPIGGIRYPCMGSIAASELGNADLDLPNFVAVRGVAATKIGAGFLPTRHAPFGVTNPGNMPANVPLPSGVDAGRLGKRLNLMKRMEKDYADAGNAHIVAEHQDLYDSAKKLTTSAQLKVFDLSEEKAAVHDRYGKNPTGQGCLLARRLIERGVPFVEVQLGHPMASASWDTHKDHFRVGKLLTDWCDPAYAALLTDLKERGMLQNTLVIWMGEFGRTPKINKDAGRDHNPKAFSVALAGGGVKGGQAIGVTNSDTSDVKDRPISVADLFCTFYHGLEIDPRGNNRVNDRPIKIVDGGNAVKEVYGA
jgi:uncharacterized protein (DUF1501 family)